MLTYYIPLHYANVIMLLYVCKETCLIYVCMYVLTSIFIQVYMHEYLGR